MVFLLSFGCFDKFYRQCLMLRLWNLWPAALISLTNISVRLHWEFIFWESQIVMFYFYLVKKYNFKNKKTLLNTGFLYCWWVTMEKKRWMCLFLQVTSFQDLCELYVEIMMNGGYLWGARPEELRSGFQGANLFFS